MYNRLTEHKWSLLFLIAISSIILLSFLGNAPLFDPDEPVYGQTAKEMLAAGDLLSPRIYGHFWYDKPPMFYWLVAGAYSLFGVNEFSTRLPSAILGIATVLYVYWQGYRLFNRRTGFISAIVLLTSFGFFYIGKAAVTDMTLVFMTTVTMCAFLRKQYYLAYIFCGLSLLTKGPIGYGFPALIMLLFILATRHWQLLREMKIPQGILLAFLVGLPWYIAMYQVHGEPFLDTFIGFHNINRFTVPEHPGKNSIFLYIPVLLLLMYPWGVGLFSGVYHSMRHPGPHKEKLLFLNIWAWFIFIFFSASKTQLVTYIAPMLPPLALIMGWYIDTIWQGKTACPRLWSILYIFFGTALTAGTLIGANQDPLLAGNGWILALLFFLFTAGTSFYLYRSKWQPYLLSTVAGIVIFSLFLFSFIVPKISDDLSTKKMAAQVAAQYDGYSPLYVDEFFRPSLAFYADIYGIEWKKPTTATSPQGNEKVYYVIRSRKLDSTALNRKESPSRILFRTTESIFIVNP